MNDNKIKPQPNLELASTSNINEIRLERGSFCPNCGERTDDKEIRYCPRCGSDI